jgi:hypothetical protein
MPTARARPFARLAIAVLVAAAIAVPSPASAGDGRIVRRGTCTASSDWKLDVRQEEGARLRVTLEIEGGRSGQAWHIFLSDNGVRIFSGTRTSGSGGYLEVRVRTTDRAGADVVKAAANNVASGESCTGRATL